MIHQGRFFGVLASVLGLVAVVACGGDDTGGSTSGGTGDCDKASDCAPFTCPGGPGEIRACVGGHCGTAADSCGGGTGGGGGN